MIQAAGILFRTATGQVLVLRRADGAGDCAGFWDIPGGKVEDGETLADAAIRECREETGYEVETAGVPLMRRVLNEVDYTTFLKDIVEPFVPTLNDEHTAFAWILPADAMAETPAALVPPPLEQSVPLEA